MNRFWSDADIRTVAALLREGRSASEIARLTQRSKGSIVGIVHRTPELTDIGFANLSPIMLDAEGRKVRRPPPPKIIGLATVRKEKTLVELTSFQCRFPIGPTEEIGHWLFCAEVRADDSSYCAAHKKLCSARQGSLKP